MSDTTFHLEIVTPAERKYAGDVTLLVVPGVVGEMGILANHAPIFTLLQPGVLRYRESRSGEAASRDVPMSGEANFQLAVGEGFLQVAENTARCVVETAERPDEVDTARAQKKIDDSRTKLAAEGPKLDQEDRERLQRRIRRNEARLKIVSGA